MRIRTHTCLLNLFHCIGLKTLHLYIEYIALVPCCSLTLLSITIILLTIRILTLIELLILTTKCGCPPYFIIHYFTLLSYIGYNHFAISSENFCDRITLYWMPLVKLSRESAFTRRYRLRFRPQTPSSRTISALNSANVDCFPLAMLNRVSYVNETTLLSRVNLCHWYIRSRSTEPIPADPFVNYSQFP